MWDELGENLLLILVSIILLLLNGFFVAAEFALVKLRESRIKILIRNKRPFSKTADWLHSHLDSALSACQLGITMASLGLGWIGEPALADILRPLFHSLGIQSEGTLHSVAFTLAFITITALHIVVGEQTPKMMAILKPEFTILSCAFPLKIFYVVTYPFMWVLNKSADFLLKVMGFDLASAHDAPLSEEELRALLSIARARGKLTPSKHNLFEGIFDLDTHLARQIMVPRPDVVFFRLDQSVEECIEIACRTKHTRFPLCKNSLDDAMGVVHIKDLLGYNSDSPLDLKSIARQPRFVPETLSAGNLLKQFQAARQHLAFVLDEHGAVQGIVTLENALEELIGNVQDEFDEEEPNIVPAGPLSYVISGQTPLEEVNEKLGIRLEALHVDTLSGLLFKHAGRVLNPGDRIDLGQVISEVLEVRSTRAWKIRVTLVRIQDEGTTSGKKEL